MSLLLPKVVRVAPELHHEAGPRRYPDWAPDRVVLAAHFSRGPVISRSFHELLSQLASHDYDVVVLSASEFPEPLVWPDGLPERTTVMRRPNVGHDFGSWAAGIHEFPLLRGASRVVITNDSLVGPFRSLDRELAAMEDTAVDVWGLAESYQIAPHLQSYFMCFRDGVLLEPPLARFWANVRVQPDKLRTVLANEVGLSAKLIPRCYTMASSFPASGMPKGINGTAMGWRQMLDRDFPFVKRMLVAGEEFRHDSLHVSRTEVAEAVRARYGVELEEWM